MWVVHLTLNDTVGVQSPKFETIEECYGYLRSDEVKGIDYLCSEFMEVDNTEEK